MNIFYQEDMSVLAEELVNGYALAQIRRLTGKSFPTERC